MRRLLLLFFLLLWPATGHAAVTISFYSRDFGMRYPHAFIVLRGTLDSTGEAVDANFGWTTTAPDLVVVTGRWVKGSTSSVDASYIRKSQEDFSLILTDEEYLAVMARVQDWRARPQPSYSLNEANCVYFVADIARTLGLKADPRAGLMLKPKTFLLRVRDDNRAMLASRGLSLAVSPPPPPPPAEPGPPGPTIATN
jgi:hypothetical protein